MQISYDDQADAMYIRFREGKFVKNKEVAEGIILDLGKKGVLLGIEILEASLRCPARELNRFDIRFPLHLTKGIT